MTNQQLLDYIKSQLQLGLTKEKISNDLLGAGWTAEDIEEGFKFTVSPVSPPSYAPISPSFINTNTSSPVQTKSHSNAKLFLTILILFLILGGGASAYFFRSDLVKLPILKDIFPNKNIVVNTEVPVSNTDQVQNLPTAPIMVDGVLDCGSDVNCFIAAANDCQKSKLNVVVKDKEVPILKIGTVSSNTDYSIGDKEKNNCVARIKVSDYALKYNADMVASLLKSGKTQVDIEKMQNDLSKLMIGSGQICKLDLTKKMGDILNLNLISGTDPSAKYTLSGASYYSGLNCEQFAQLNDNPKCNLNLSAMGGSTNSFSLAKGMTASITALGFSGLESQISWFIKDKNIITISPIVGKTINAKFVGTGSTELTVTDNSIQNCSVSLPIGVLN